MDRLLQHSAISYLQHELSVLPAKRAEKRPCIGSWKQYQKRRPTQTELRAWLSNPQDGLCIITGRVSGNLEIIDFDNGGELFAGWYELIPEDLQEQLVIEQTPSDGWHVIYRYQSNVSGNMKLAQRKDGSKVQTLIETRGEGGLFLCAPTGGYRLTQGDLMNLPVLTLSQRETLLQAAWSLNEYIPEPAEQSQQSDNSSLRPGDDYNTCGNVADLLRSHGWQLVNTYGDNQRWRRPDKAHGWSATLRTTDNVFYVFSSNASPFEPNKAYSPFMVYSLLEHGGNCSKAAAELSRQGYGQKQEPAGNVDLSGIVPDEEYPWDDGSVSLTEMIANFQGLNKPIIHGLLREGETMNVIASPKIGKSWLVNSLTISIASGMDWLGLKINQGRVLLIDNELHQNTTTYRYMEVTKALNLPSHLYSDQLRVRSLRGQLKDMNELSNIFNRIKPGRYAVIVIDAFYRTLPAGTDENDNGAIAALYNQLDIHACRLNCAFILIHHTSKGNQANKSVTDVGAGAGAQSRAADTHVILRAHEDDNKVVMDAATRSWPPLDTLVLAKQHPLFMIDDDADPTALLGSLKTGKVKSSIPVEEFVESCIASQDPCIFTEIARRAQEKHNLSRRQVQHLVEEAIENELILRMNIASRTCYIKFREGFSGEKGQWVAALLAHDPDADAAQIASVTGASERYIRMIKSGNETEMA